MKKITFALAVLAAFLLCLAPRAQAGSASTNLSVSVDVDDACFISTSPVTFPVYSPIGANATSPDDSTGGSVTITCTVGTVSTIGLGAGSYALAGQSRMQNSSSHFLNYSLYQDSSHTTVWGNTSPSWLSVAAAPTTDPRTYPVYARIPGGQSGSGHFSDNVQATVNF